MVLLLVLVGITFVTLSVGILGIARIAKDRPPLKSYEMRFNSASSARQAAKTLIDSCTGSHMRASDPSTVQPESLVKRALGWVLQFLGIPLLTGYHADEIMGNTAKPTTTLIMQAATPLDRSSNQCAEVDALRDSKSALVDKSQQLQDEPQWNDQVSDSDQEEEEEESDTSDEEKTDDDKMQQLRSQYIVDGLQFYAAVAQLSISTANHVVDMGLLRATTVVLRERRKAHEDASILAIEQCYPDITCLASSSITVMKKPATIDCSTPTEMLPRASITTPTARVQLETGFLTAA